MGRVTKIVGIFSPSQSRTSSRFNSHHTDFRTTSKHFTDEWKNDPGEIRTASCTADHHIRIIPRHLHLFDRFLSDNGLMHQHMIEHTPQCIFDVIILGRNLDCF